LLRSAVRDSHITDDHIIGMSIGLIGGLSDRGCRASLG
jgi:hypothetical protein